MIRNQLRYERKFIVNNQIFNDLENLRSFLSINIYEKYNSRKVNSIYYDTPNLELASQTIEGINCKNKIRVRYYGDIENINNSKLEIKLKKGLVGDKYIFDIPDGYLKSNDFYLRNIPSLNKISQNQITSLKVSEPKLIISYKRKYFISSCERFRFTFDSDIMFKKFDINNQDSNFKENFLFYKNNILEIKYSLDDENYASYIIQKSPFRLTSISKYLIALEYLGLKKPF